MNLLTRIVYYSSVMPIYSRREPLPDFVYLSYLFYLSICVPWYAYLLSTLYYNPPY